MIKYYVYENGSLRETEQSEPGCWISVVQPTPQEVRELVETYGLDSGFVKSSLDEEESSRIEREDDQTLVIIDTPVSSVDDDQTKNFYTQPVGIIKGDPDNHRSHAGHDKESAPELQDEVCFAASSANCRTFPHPPQADRQDIISSRAAAP